MTTESPALLINRERFHLAYRAAGRLHQVLIARSRGPAAGRLGAVGAWTVVDLATAALLNRSPRFGLGPRLFLDVIDTAYWSRHDDNVELATMPAIPLSIEAGVRLGALGLAAPAANLAATWAVRRVRGRPTPVAAFRFQIMGVALGAGISAYRANHRKVALRRHEQNLEAQIGAAHLAGQHDVAMGADTVVDLLSRTTPLLAEADTSMASSRMLADWRQSLAARTSLRATYLGVALVRWQRLHNEAHHLLASDVTLDLAPGQGAILLSAQQSSALDAALDELSLHGTVAASVMDIAAAHQPNQPIQLDVGGHLVTIPADPMPGLVPFDIGPIGFLASSLYFVDNLAPGECEPNPWAVAPTVAAGPLLAMWAHRQVTRRGPQSHPQVLAAALAHAMIHSVTSTGTMASTRNAAGVQRFPFLGGVNMLSVMVPTYWPDLDRRQRVLVLGGLVSIVGVGLVLFPEPLQWTHVAAELLWPLAALVSMFSIGTQHDADSRTFADELDRSAADRLEAAFLEGRSFVLGLVSGARYRARQQLNSVGLGLDPRTRIEVTRRLDEVDERLAALQ